MPLHAINAPTMTETRHHNFQQLFMTILHISNRRNIPTGKDTVNEERKTNDERGGQDQFESDAAINTRLKSASSFLKVSSEVRRLSSSTSDKDSSLNDALM